MAHEHGAYLGSIRSIADVRERCVIDGDCWHLRTARGRPQQRDLVHRIWVYGRGSISATKAVWQLAHGVTLGSHLRAIRTCSTYDCANPDHIRAMTHSSAQSFLVGKGAEMSPARRAALAKLRGRRRRFTVEQVAEIRNGTEAAYSIARRWGASPTSISAIRAGKSYRDVDTSPLALVWRRAA
jgi:hypothetical protein